MSGGLVSAVAPVSIAEELGIRPGDVLVVVNGHTVRDVLDVQFYAADEDLELVTRRGDREIVYQVEREYGVPLGLDFGSPTFDGMRRCDNRCEFCFVAQMPPGLRRSLYVRDDDYRYSVLYGSYITLTNLTAEDWARLDEQRLSPLYISVHATEPALRQRLLGRPGIPEVLHQIDRLAEMGIEMHTQVVLVPGENDGEHLARTVEDLAARYPAVRSIGVVPVGLTRYHRGKGRRYAAGEARALIDQIAPVQAGYRRRHGVSLVYLADEWYLLAGVGVPTVDDYDGFPQLENGIGLVRQLLDDASSLVPSGQASTVRVPRLARRGSGSGGCLLVCGTLIAPVMGRLAEELSERSGVQIEVVPVANRLFGETVTVSGLLSGKDVIAVLEGCADGEVVFLPQAMFAEHIPGQEMSDGHGYTLDGLTVRDVEQRLGSRVVVAEWLSEVWEFLVADRGGGER